MGRSLFTAGTVTDSMCHEADEVALVIDGAGFLLLDGGRVDLIAGQACHIPAGVWHAVGTDETDMAMVFGFSSPSYPPTEFRPIP
ncbi:MAG: cupin domain-containing protein [Armatimonadetes bacterium]|nr:MAG: cupin domain-containing protein [Armatimonadota bacterium]